MSYTDYTTLPGDVKLTLLTQSAVCGMAFQALQELSGVPEDEWAREIFSAAGAQVIDLSDQEVDQVIVFLQKSCESEGTTIKLRKESERKP